MGVRQILMSISSRFINLRVRTKLYLFILIPLITMLSLIGIAISDKYSQKSNSEHIYQFTTVVFELTELVHSLQKERGLSAGFIGSEGRLFREELVTQRQQSDERLSQVRIRLSELDPLKIFWGFSEEFDHLLNMLKRLPEIRNQIDSSGRSHFSYYSNINAIAINIAHHLQAKHKEPSLSHLSELFTVLIELQERSGQERGLLNQVFSQKQLNLETFQDIAVYIALQQESINHYLNTAHIDYRSLLQELLDQPIEAEITALRTASFNKWQRNELLNKLHSFIGYGGLIHDFKNYVIRGLPFYYDRFTVMFADARQILFQFRQIDGLGKQDLTHVDTIEATFRRYQELLDTVTRMRSDGATVVAIDKVVKVDDTPALGAIEALRSDITTLDTSSWWQSATKRIELFKEISDVLQDDILQNIQQQRRAAEQAFYLYIALMLFVITTTLLLAYLLINRLAKETSQIASAMNQMHQSGEFGTLTLRGGDDEIGEIVSAFNTLVEKRNQAETEHLEIQQQLLEAKKMSTLYKLSGGVAHNFNNMLAAIIGYSSMAMLHKDVKNSEKVKSYLNNINAIVEKAGALVEKVVTYSQADLRARESTTLLGTMVETLLEDQKRQLPSAIRLNYQIEADLPPVRIDMEHFKQIFDALLSNAKEAVLDKGLIDIRLQMTTLNGERCSACGEKLAGSFVEFSIADSGVGIATDKIEHIFEPFFTTKDLSEGAGMGLAMAYGFIRSCGGHTIVESTPGEGSKFRVLLPTVEVNS